MSNYRIYVCWECKRIWSVLQNPYASPILQSCKNKCNYAPYTILPYHLTKIDKTMIGENLFDLLQYVRNYV